VSWRGSIDDPRIVYALRWCATQWQFCWIVACNSRFGRRVGRWKMTAETEPSDEDRELVADAMREQDDEP
jgi:hypothetical protein